jgi:hypothetical protein
MARFHGKVGYGIAAEDPLNSGVWKDTVTELPYFGDVIRNIRQLENGTDINDNISVNNSISIIASPYAIEHFARIKYVEWMGTRWTVSSVEVRLPRLILSLGSVYNGPTPS